MAEWGFEASLVIKRAMRARAWDYAKLADALKALGMRRSAAVINRRINRGNFSAGFLLACLNVLGGEENDCTDAGTKATNSDTRASGAVRK